MDIVLIGLRGLSLASVLAAFGCSVFAFVIGPDTIRLRRFSLLAALGLTLIWLICASAAMANAEDLAQALAALPIVTLDTQFGRLGLARLAALLVAIALDRQGPSTTLFATALALALQPAMGHAGATGGTQGNALLISETIHLLAAGAWLGGLLPLLIHLSRLPPTAASRLSRAFFPLGLSCVLLLAGTGFLQAIILVDNFSALTASDYGQMITVKLVLFAMLLLLAIANRFIFTDRLQTGRFLLLGSVALETGLGLAVILAASRLASLPPVRGL
jgi:putative copper export protein